MKKYKAYFCGELDHEFTEADTEAMQHMDSCLSSHSDTWDFEDETGKAVFPKYSEDYRTATAGDYSPATPWNAPGMSVTDFI